MTPDFVLALRRHIGTAPLPLVGVTAIVVKDDRILLGRRSDNGLLAPLMGVLEPGEEPAVCAVREVAEEAGIEVEVEALAWVHQTPRLTFANGDQADFLDLTFRCRWVAGEPRPADGELTEVGWWPSVPAEVEADHRARIEQALSRTPVRFET